MNYCAEVSVMLKNGIRDPQGTALEAVLKRTDLSDKTEIKVGKYFILNIDAENEEAALFKLNRICSEMLSNPMLELYKIERFYQR